ncbi:MAG: elongation factor 4 [Spirochaetales bacterium]|nr:elongation factor 4 [Spirochaetales bacterium]
MKVSRDRIRNFCIIAHIDHGKSTLADRFIELGKVIEIRNMVDQVLDDMDIERERGITIKSHAISIPYTCRNGETYILNLVDTPGHVDFTYEVSRAISACEGALLLIDATQGVEAQTLSNMYLALEHDLEIVPVINKIDLPAADPVSVRHQIEHDLGLDPEIAVEVSAKTGAGVEHLLEELVRLIPPPPDGADATQALIFDSHYDSYRGVIIHVRVVSGTFKSGDRILLMNVGAEYGVEETGIFGMSLVPKEELSAGEVGYLIAGIKTVSDIRVGDTITNAYAPCSRPLPGFREIKPVVFSSVYPIDSNDYEELHGALGKLKLNDASLIYERDSSVALGFGFRCGFLGLLHLEVVQERIEREYGLSIVLTSPSVKYKIRLTSGKEMMIDNPVDYPDPSIIDQVEEPYIRASIITPAEYIGSIMNLCLEKRGNQKNMTYLDEKRVELVYELPLADVIFDFYDRLKSVSRGYASFDYEVDEYRPTDLVRLEVLINGNVVDALTTLVYRQNAPFRARAVCKSLRDEIPRQQFKIPIQGAIGSQIIARETVPALRKDVTAKCYGGDITRKRKLLEKQKEGKKRMKMVGNVEIPQSAFLSVLRTDTEKK